MDICDFQAEDETIEIVPTFKDPEVLNLINGDFGPFVPGIPTRVPIWMAMVLFNQQKCKIILPPWISYLDSLTEQQNNSNTLIKMPSDHWREIIKILETHNLELPHDPLALIEYRQNVLRNSLGDLLDTIGNTSEDKIAQVMIKNITKFELMAIKKIITSNLSISKTIQEKILETEK